MIVALELGETKRKVMVERTIDGETDWLVGYLINGDDAERLKIQFDMMGTIMFKEYEQAEIAYANYHI